MNVHDQAATNPASSKPCPPWRATSLSTIADERPDAQAIKEALTRLSPLVDGSDVVLGIGPSLVRALGAQVPGLHEFPALSGHGVQGAVHPRRAVVLAARRRPGRPAALTRKVQKALAPAFAVRHVVDAFRHAWATRPWPRPDRLRGRHRKPGGRGGRGGRPGRAARAGPGRLELRGGAAVAARPRRLRGAGRRGPATITSAGAAATTRSWRTRRRRPTSSARRRRASTRKPSCCAAPCPG